MKDATNARVEYDVKTEAEDILQKLGIPAGLPTVDHMSENEFNAKIRIGYEQSLRGEGRPFDEVFGELERLV